MLFGSPISLIYSITGAVLSLAVMFLLKKLTPLSEIAVSVSGGVTHNVGQICAASVMLGTNVVVYYLPFLLLSGTVAGIVVGVASGVLIKKVNLKYIIKNTSGKRPSESSVDHDLTEEGE
jgi:heptaprenyl diphosphate synthase